MGKKKAFTKGNTKGGKVAKNIFKVATATQGKKKTKVVKTQIKKVNHTLTMHFDSSDRTLSVLLDSGKREIATGIIRSSTEDVAWTNGREESATQQCEEDQSTGQKSQRTGTEDHSSAE